MEERIIDDEYGRGVRMKKTKDGYVDVTDAEVDTEEVGDEIAFEFPVQETDTDDEAIAMLTPEQAMEFIRKREEETRLRKEAYDNACAQGEALLGAEDYAGAEKVYENALKLDDEAEEASVGYWRAKTANFTNPDVLIAEYADSSIESLEYDLGYNATQRIKKEFSTQLTKRYEEIRAEEEPLSKLVEEKREKRREILKERLSRATVGFVCATVPMAVLLVLTIVLGTKIFSTPDNTFVLSTILVGVAFFISFIVFILLTNKWINVFRIRRANEKFSSTEDGAKVEKLRSYMAIYEALLQVEE